MREKFSTQGRTQIYTRNITHAFLNNLKPTGEEQRIPVGESFFLRVSPKGKKTWYLRYDTFTPEGKRKQNAVSIGQFPKMGLKEARAESDLRRTLAKDDNASLVQVRKEELIQKAQPKVVHTFQSVADEWLDLKMMEWEERSGKQNWGRLVANVYPEVHFEDRWIKLYYNLSGWGVQFSCVS